jgi:hypothetical protein
MGISATGIAGEMSEARRRSSTSNDHRGRWRGGKRSRAVGRVKS